MFIAMDNGFIILSRGIIDSDVFASQKLLKIWVWCLCRASFKDRTIPISVGKGESIVNIKRGQFIFGRHKAEDELFIDGSTIYKAMKKLQEIGNITIKSNNQYSIVTICNYDKYQDVSNYKVTAKEQPSNNQVTANEQPSNTNNKDNKVNKDNKFIPPQIEEVKAYCIERKNNVDAQKFIDFYESKGWMVGKNKMKDWRASVRTWEKESKKGYDKTNITEAWKNFQGSTKL